MKTLTSLESLQELMYAGQLEEKQFPTQSFNDYSRLSETQNLLFNRAIKGLEIYSQEELYAMNSSKKTKIFKKQKEVQTMLNLWKQEITNRKTNALLNELFPKSAFIAALIDNTEVSKNYTNTLSFKELGINKVKIINKMIDENFLPKNFAAL
jgi:hypothetical protein